MMAVPLSKVDGYSKSSVAKMAMSVVTRPDGWLAASLRSPVKTIMRLTLQWRSQVSNLGSLGGVPFDY